MENAFFLVLRFLFIVKRFGKVLSGVRATKQLVRLMSQPIKNVVMPESELLPPEGSEVCWLAHKMLTYCVVSLKNHFFG